MTDFSTRFMGKKKIFGCVTMMILAMGIAVSGLATKAYAAEGGNKYEDILTQDISNIKTIDIGSISAGTFGGYKVETGITGDDKAEIVVEITQNGAYKLTGMNGKDTDSDKIPDTDLKDIQFVIDKGVTADLYLDELSIFNEKYVSGTSYKGIHPFIFNGNGNICIDEDSVLYAVGPSFSVGSYGKLRFVKSKDDAKLTVGLAKLPDPGLNYGNRIYVIDGGSEISFYDAIVEFTLSDKEGNISESDYNLTGGFNCVNLFGEGFSFGKKVEVGKATIGIYQFKDDPNISFEMDPYMMGTNYGQDITDTHGNNFRYCGDYGNLGKNYFYGFSANAHIVQIDKTPVTGVSADNNGNVYRAFFPNKECYIFARDTGNKLSAYKWLNIYYKFKVSDGIDAYEVTLKDAETGEEYMSYYAATGEKYVLLPESLQWDYKYYRSTDKAPVTADSTVDGNITVLVEKHEKGSFDVIVDGERKTAKYGDSIASVLPEGKKDRIVILIPTDSNPKELVDPENTTKVLEESIELKTVSLGHSTDEYSRLWFELRNKDDVTEFASLVNAPYNFVNICGRLCDDVILDESYPMIGTNMAFEGIFEGQGHTVTLSISKQNDGGFNGFFSWIGGKAQIKDLNIKGFVTGGECAGGFVGGITTRSETEIRITNCTNYAEISATPRDDYEFCAGGIVGKSFFMNKQGSVIIANCANYGKVTGEDSSDYSFAGGIISAGYYNNVTIINCINADESYIIDKKPLDIDDYENLVKQVNCYSVKNTLKDYEKSKEAFVSGEVTYLLNQKKYDDVTWYQTCGEGFPSTKGDAKTQTVYAGYASCKDEAVVYANTELSKTAISHALGGWISNGNGTHTRKCSAEGCTYSETVKCSGTEATCVHKAVCKTCGKEFGELKAHSWSSWTGKKDGTETRTCTVTGCGAHETRDSEEHKNAVKLTKGISAKVSGNKVKVSWGKVTGAKGYEIYIGYCGSKFSKTPAVIVKGNKKTSYTVNKINKKAINGKKNIKLYVKAFKYNGKKRVSIGQSMEIDVVGSANKSYTNPKSVKVKSKNVKLSVGKSSTIKPSLVMDKASGKIPSKGYVSKFRFLSSSPSVATVSTKGKIKAVKAGKATIYVYAPNGKYATVKVTVK